jgi:hypothetical protein
MGAVRQTLLFVLALAGGISASQAPEFAQQYRQRIGGAIEELGRVVAEFDQDAAENGLTREQALDVHVQSPEALFRSRGESMQETIDRYATLLRQQRDFAARSPLLQPLVLADSDETILAGAWRDFRPAVPVTEAGLAWAAAGFALTAFLAFLAAKLLRWLWRRAAPPRRPVQA